MKFKIDLGVSSFNDLQILNPFCPLINIYVSIDRNHTIFNIDNIKFKEKFYYNELKNIYIDSIINYLNVKSNELFLNDIKGHLLEKNIILNILTGQINSKIYKNYLNFKEIKIQSLYCLNYNKDINYEDNKNKNVVITQENQTSEFYDFAFKINKNNKNYMKFIQISIFKDDIDLSKLNKESITLDLINFNLDKEKLNIGKIESYSFIIITSINVFKDYKKLDDKNKVNNTFFKMKEFCKKNNFEFYIYDYFENEINI